MADPYSPPQGPAMQPYVPPGRPPLDPAGGRSALWAGGVALPLMTIGLNIVGTAVAVAFFAVIFAGLDALGPADDSSSVFPFGDAPSTVALGVVLGVLGGLAVTVGGLLASYGILRRARHSRPWGITFAASGIALACLWVLSTLVGFVASLVGGTLAEVDPLGTAEPWVRIALGVGVGIVVLLLVVLSGVLTWRWMAHALRASAPRGSE